jgi:hypothetical protein
VFLGNSNNFLSNSHDVKLSRDGKVLFVSGVGSERVVGLDADTLDFIDAFGADVSDGTKDIDLDEGHLMSDHVHIMISIPPK